MSRQGQLPWREPHPPSSSSPEVGHAPPHQTESGDHGVTIRTTCVCQFARGLQEVLCRSRSPTMHDVFGLPLVPLTPQHDASHDNNKWFCPLFPFTESVQGNLVLVVWVLAGGDDDDDDGLCNLSCRASKKAMQVETKANGLYLPYIFRTLFRSADLDPPSDCHAGQGCRKLRGNLILEKTIAKPIARPIARTSRQIKTKPNLGLQSLR